VLIQALAAHQRSLELRETCLDPDDPSVARSLQLQAELHAQTGKLLTAEMLYRQSVDVLEASLGRTHPDVGRALHLLAVFYQKQGKLVNRLAVRSLPLTFDIMGDFIFSLKPSFKLKF